jgi:hypothetical protein
MYRAFGVASILVALCLASACKRGPEPQEGAAPARATSSASAARAASAPPPAPTIEKLVPVKTAAAPLIPELEDDERASQVPRAGDLLVLGNALPPMKWKADMDGTMTTREGPMAEVRRAPGDALLFGFMSDLGEPVEVPAAGVLCARLQAALPALPPALVENCPHVLRRAKTLDGALVAYVNCSVGPCPVGLLRGDHLGAVTVDGVVDARFGSIGGKSLLLASSRWVKDGGTWTGGTIVPILLDGAAPKPLDPIPTDEVDARAPVDVVQRNVRVEFGSDTVRVVGERRIVDRNTGKDRSKVPIDERHRLPGGANQP